MQLPRVDLMQVERFGQHAIGIGIELPCEALALGAKISFHRQPPATALPFGAASEPSRKLGVATIRGNCQRARHRYRFGLKTQVSSEERRAGKESVSTCGSRWSPYL